MNDEYKELIDLVCRVRNRRRTISISENLILLFFTCSVLVIGMSVLEYFFIDKLAGRIVMFLRFAMLVPSAVLTAYVLCRFLPVLRKHDDDSVARFIQEKKAELRDDLINSLQLYRRPDSENISGVMVDELVRRTAEKNRDIKPEEMVVFNSKFYLGLLSAALVSLVLFCLVPPWIVPTALPGVLRPMQFPMSASEILARQLNPPQIGNLQIKIHFPDYTGYSDQILPGGDIEVLRKSRAYVKAVTGRNVEKAFLVTPAGRVEMKLNKGTGQTGMITAEGEFIVSRDGEFYLKAVDSENLSNEPVHYKVRALPDEPPQVSVLAPAFDIMTAPSARLKIVAEARDDFGLTRLGIAWKLKGKTTQKTIEDFQPAVGHQITEYQWDLSKLGLKKGDLLDFWLEAWDNDTIDGPKKAVSSVYKLEIISMEEQLDRMGLPPMDDQAIEEAMRRAEELLKESGELLNRIEDLKGKAGPEDLEKLKSQMDKLAGLLESLRQALAQMSQQVPEELVDRENLDELGFGELMNDYKELQKKITSGQLEEALELSKQLSRQLAGMLEQLKMAGQRSRMYQASRMAKEMKQQMNELDKLAEEESKVITDTSDMDQEKMKEMMQAQEDMLKELAEEEKKIFHDTVKVGETAQQQINTTAIWPAFSNQQRILVSDLQTAVTMFESRNFRSLMPALQRSMSDLSANEKIARDFSASEKQRSADLAGKITQMGESASEEKNKLISEKAAADEKAGQAGTIADRFNDLAARQQKIIDALTGASAEAGRKFSRNRQGDLKNVSASQARVRGNTEQLKNRMSQLNMKTSGSCGGACQNMDTAIGKMAEAEGSLIPGMTQSALSSEIEALSNLAGAKQSLNQSLGKISSLEGGGRNPSGLITLRKGMLEGGVTGTAEGFVRLPSAKDFQPSKEFRQEILEAIKEKFPPAYREMIEEYYRRLTE